MSPYVWAFLNPTKQIIIVIKLINKINLIFNLVIEILIPHLIFILSCIVFKLSQISEMTFSVVGFI